MKQLRHDRKFYIWSECAGNSAKLTIEWSPKKGAELPSAWEDKAEEIADQAFTKAAPYIRDIVEAMRGRWKT